MYKISFTKQCASLHDVAAEFYRQMFFQQVLILHIVGYIHNMERRFICILKNTCNVTVDILEFHFCADKLKGIHKALGNNCSRQDT